MGYFIGHQLSYGIFTSSFHGRQMEEAGLSIPLFQPKGSRHSSTNLLSASAAGSNLGKKQKNYLFNERLSNQ